MGSDSRKWKGVPLHVTRKGSLAAVQGKATDLSPQKLHPPPVLVRVRR